ncbi:MAG: hypothetical protein U1E89_00945 [Burkholderiaceae bacterium]
MSLSFRSLQNLAGATAVALLFNTSGVAFAADAAVPRHPLLEAVHSMYLYALSDKVAQVAGPEARLRVGAFVAGALEPKLKAPSDKPQLAGYPNPAVNGELVISSIVPPVALYPVANVPVCVEKDGNILATYEITPAGKVNQTQYTGPVTTSPMPAFAFACKNPMLAARNSMLEALSAQATPTPTPGSTTRP